MDLEKYAGWASIAAVLSVLHVCRVKVFFPSAGFFQCQFDNEQSGSRIGLFVGPPTEPPEWKAAMEKAWWYKASCLVLIPPGLITMVCVTSYSSLSPFLSPRSPPVETQWHNSYVTLPSGFVQFRSLTNNNVNFALFFRF